jgi:hypothetical protein
MYILYIINQTKKMNALQIYQNDYTDDYKDDKNMIGGRGGGYNIAELLKKDNTFSGGNSIIENLQIPLGLFYKQTPTIFYESVKSSGCIDDTLFDNLLNMVSNHHRGSKPTRKNIISTSLKKTQRHK